MFFCFCFFVFVFLFFFLKYMFTYLHAERTILHKNGLCRMHKHCSVLFSAPWINSSIDSVCVLYGLVHKVISIEQIITGCTLPDFAFSLWFITRTLTHEMMIIASSRSEMIKGTEIHTEWSINVIDYFFLKVIWDATRYLSP